MLLTRLIEEARRRYAADLLLEVRADNPRAQQLYLRFGFEQIHVRPRYYRDGVDALIMRLPLTGPAGPETEQETGNHTTPEAGRP
jgi:ribosomal-protein-alanine N-acetyltransferase